MTPRPELTEERVNALERLAKRAFVEVEIEVLNGLIAYWRESEALVNNPLVVEIRRIMGASVMTDSEYEEACHRAQQAARAKCEEFRQSILKWGNPSYQERMKSAYRAMLAAYEAKEWMPEPEVKG